MAKSRAEISADARDRAIAKGRCSQRCGRRARSGKRTCRRCCRNRAEARRQQKAAEA
jgi:hypothetical protein